MGSFPEMFNEKEHDNLTTQVDKSSRKAIKTTQGECYSFYLHCCLIFIKYIFPLLCPILYKRQY